MTGSDKVQRNKNNGNNEEYDKELKNNKEDNSVSEDDGYASVGKNKKNIIKPAWKAWGWVSCLHLGYL